MDRRFTRPSDGESSENAKCQKAESNTTGGFASGPVRRRETLFRPLPDLQTSSSDHSMSPNQAKQAKLDLTLRLGIAAENQAKQAELDLILQLAPPQIDSASPHELVAQNFLTRLDQVPWEQAMQIQQAVHDQAGPSDQAEAAFAQQITWATRQLHQQPESTSYEMPVSQQTENFLAQPLKQRNLVSFLLP